VRKLRGNIRLVISGYHMAVYVKDTSPPAIACKKELVQ